MLKAARAPRVLVVDDEPAILDLLTTRLSLAGYEAHSARDGAEAISRILELHPQAMVLDVNMPGLDGFGVLKWMAEKGKTSVLPTMVLTARHQKDDVVRAIKLGAKDYLTKPFNDQVFLQRVARLLKARGPKPPQGGDDVLRL